MKAIVLTGPPRSGKSTYVSNLKFQGLIFSTDNILLKKAKQENISYEESFQKYIDDAVREMNERILENIASPEPKDVLFDQTHLSVKKRNIRLDQIRQHKSKNIYAKLVIFNSKLITIVNRNKNDTVRSPMNSNTIIDMFCNFELPEESEKSKWNEIEYVS